LITDQGRRVLLRVHGRLYELTQDELRSLLGLPAGPAGLGVTIDGERFRFEFVGVDKAVELSSRQLYRQLAKQTADKS
jgi:hypothetical protein